MIRRRTLRIAVVLVVLLCSAFLVQGYATNSVRGDWEETYQAQAELPMDEREQVAPASDGITVIAAQPRPAPEREFVDGAMYAFGEDGRLLYYENDLTSYFDVDPEPTGDRTVLHIGYRIVEEDCVSDSCYRNVIRQVNITTGETNVLFSQVSDGKWHDVDRIDEDHLLVGDIARDRAFIIDLDRQMVEWSWNAQQDYPLSTGGPYPEDWTHLNDVEYVGNDTIMVSLRNQDRVVFVHRERGVLHNRTLGEEDNYSILYEQHNPDYIPAEQGGPSVIVADSENDRVVEYQRQNGTWNQSWMWEDARLGWPRDADRLPNGNTLVSDSHGDRVLEVGPDGEIVWSVNVGHVYDAERLGTGDESTGGPSAAAANLSGKQLSSDSGGDGSAGLLTRVRLQIVSLFPGKIVNGIRFVMPQWMHFVDAIVVAILGATLLGWSTLEAWWQFRSKVGVQSPVYRR